MSWNDKLRKQYGNIVDDYRIEIRQGNKYMPQVHISYKTFFRKKLVNYWSDLKHECYAGTIGCFDILDMAVDKIERHILDRQPTRVL